jgi:hypothetical protein
VDIALLADTIAGDSVCINSLGRLLSMHMLPRSCRRMDADSNQDLLGMKKQTSRRRALRNV